AANAFAVAICLNIGFRADKTHTYNALYKVTLLWATLVSVSRIFVGKHFLGDVLAGILIGSVIGYFVAMLARHIIRKHIEKVKPEGLTFHFDLKPSGGKPTVSE
ncbi:MAG: phosphatase PAP2 family protein, partial [Bacteroidales bacterium]|nr:phosphatase PAP2 family protein [Bacteroidales bacterium]